MSQYVSTARRYRWVLATVLAVVWGAGLVAASVEYLTTYESEATIWVLRPSAELTVTSPDDANLALIQTAASQQAELLTQLIRTTSFLRDVTERTSLRSDLQAANDETRFLKDIGSHFRVQTYGTNLLSLSYAAHDPRVGPEMVNAALQERAVRVQQASVTFTATANALYQKEFEVAQVRALDAQRALERFDVTHKETLTPAEDREQAQLRLALDYAQVRLGDIKGRIDRAALAPAILAISGMEFQVVDQPREEPSPRGGARPAVTLATFAIAAGLALAALLVLVGTLVSDHVAGPSDIARLAPAGLFATVADARDPAQRDLRTILSSVTFGNGHLRTEEADVTGRHDQGQAWR